MILLVRKWEHLDFYSRTMIILYQLNMTIKIVFYVLDSQIGNLPGPLPKDEDKWKVYMKSFTRSMIFLINALFLLSLHVFVMKL